jgi:5-methylcytosine-specific restriction endonuclease McrA
MTGALPPELAVVPHDVRAFPSSWRDRAIAELLRTQGAVICACCERHFLRRSELRELEADHVVPFSRGGPTTWRNLQILCRPCNRRKSDSLADR